MASNLGEKRLVVGPSWDSFKQVTKIETWTKDENGWKACNSLDWIIDGMHLFPASTGKKVYNSNGLM